MAEADTTADTTEPKAGNLSLVIAVVAAVAGAAIGGGVVAPRFGGGGHADAPAAAADDGHGTEDRGHGGGGHGGADAGPGALVELKNLIVNPAGSHGTRFLMTTVVIDVDPPKVGEELREREVEVRDAVISVLEAKTLADLTAPRARDQLKVDIHRVVVAFLPPSAAASVYLPQFVIQ